MNEKQLLLLKKLLDLESSVFVLLSSDEEFVDLSFRFSHKKANTLIEIFKDTSKGVELIGNGLVNTETKELKNLRVFSEENSEKIIKLIRRAQNVFMKEKGFDKVFSIWDGIENRNLKLRLSLLAGIQLIKTQLLSEVVHEQDKRIKLFLEKVLDVLKNKKQYISSLKHFKQKPEEAWDSLIPKEYIKEFKENFPFVYSFVSKNPYFLNVYLTRIPKSVLEQIENEIQSKERILNSKFNYIEFYPNFIIDFSSISITFGKLVYFENFEKTEEELKISIFNNRKSSDFLKKTFNFWTELEIYDLGLEFIFRKYPQSRKILRTKFLLTTVLSFGDFLLSKIF